MKYPALLLLFISLHVCTSAQVNSFNIDSTKFNKLLAASLDTIYNDDQAVRWKFVNAEHNKASSKEIDSLRSLMLQKDNQNLVKVNYILSKYGWLGPQAVGINGSQALFLVIQHADLNTQKMYLPMIIKAEKEGEILSSNLAILEDRINVREGKEQLYGSQGFADKASGKIYIYPIADPDHLDQRRKSMGMIPMKEYRKDWDIVTYKSMLPQIKALAKERYTN
jgi:hypothetical protein